MNEHNIPTMKLIMPGTGSVVYNIYYESMNHVWGTSDVYNTMFSVPKQNIQLVGGERLGGLLYPHGPEPDTLYFEVQREDVRWISDISEIGNE